jgi:hypothetical protein
MPITRIVSGGQTGADRGGLEAAIYCRVPHGGWCPIGRRAEDGRIPDKYLLIEMPTPDYLARTEANVVDSDATVVFTENGATGGSLRTIEACLIHHKPWHEVCLGQATRRKAVAGIVAWLAGAPGTGDYDDFIATPPPACVLNVAGTRHSKTPFIEDAVMRIMVDVLIAVNPACRGFYPLTQPDPLILRE